MTTSGTYVSTISYSSPTVQSEVSECRLPPARLGIHSLLYSGAIFKTPKLGAGTYDTFGADEWPYHRYLPQTYRGRPYKRSCLTNMYQRRHIADEQPPVAQSLAYAVSPSVQLP